MDLLEVRDSLKSFRVEHRITDRGLGLLWWEVRDNPGGFSLMGREVRDTMLHPEAVQRIPDLRSITGESITGDFALGSYGPSPRDRAVI